MAEAKDPLRQLIDVAVYAPIGLLTLVERELPGLISTGKARFDNQITLARFMGKMAVKQGRKIVERRIAEVAESRRTAPEPTPQPSASAAPSLTIVSDGDPIETTSRESASPTGPSAPSADLPIEGYDSLAASQVVLRLSSLTASELEAVDLYEQQHRARRTVLGKIHQLRAS